MAPRWIGLHHVQLAMPSGQEEAAERFYEGLLGLPRVAKPAGLAAEGAWFESGLLRVHLGVDPDFRPAEKAHPGLLLDGLEDLVARLETGGVSVRWDEKLEGYRRVFVSDPFGNRIELMEPKSAAAGAVRVGSASERSDR